MSKRFKRSLFKYRFSNTITLSPSNITPVFLKDTIPSDYWQIHTSGFLRLAPQLAPSYTNCYCVVHYWFVPNRLLWKNWERFITGGRSNETDGNDPTPVMPTIKLDTTTAYSTSGRCPSISSIFDYLGYPARFSNTQTTNKIFTYSTTGFNALPIRAYTKIINDWYINQDIDLPITFSDADGLDTTTYRVSSSGAYLTGPIISLWSRDYFTTCLPSPQRGTMSLVPVNIPSIPPGPTDLVAKVSKKGLTDMGAEITSSFTGTQDTIDGRADINVTPHGVINATFKGDTVTGTGDIVGDVTSTFTGISSTVKVQTQSDTPVTIPPAESVEMIIYKSSIAELTTGTPYPNQYNGVLVWIQSEGRYAIVPTDSSQDDSIVRLRPVTYGQDGMYDNNRAAFFYSYDYNTYGYKGSTRALIYATNAPGYDMEWQIGQDTNLEDDHAHNVALANFRYPSKTRVEVNYIENLTRATIGSSFKQGDSIIVNSINNLNVPKGLQSSGTYIPIGTVTSKMTGASVDYKVTPTGTITASLLGTTDTYTTGKQTNYTPKGTNSITVKKIAGNSDAQDAPVVETNELKKIDDTPQATQGTFTINDLRMATQLQIWAERSMRTGYRYVETILAHFGVHTKDYRLQMAEFLGGFKIPIQISEVVQTAPQTGTSTPMGSMAGHGIGVNHRRIKYGVTEHGFIMGLASVRAHAQYQDGVDRMFFKTNKYEYFWREFSHLTDQAVLNAELYMAGVEEVKAPTSYNNSIFGYQERYGEYKYFYNQVHGLFKTSLSYWHLGRIFADSISTDNTPKLNSDFVSIPSTFMSRLFASSDTSSQILGHFYFDCRVLRPIPKRSHPSLLDHSFGGY